jgi:hypothetical protein
MRPAAEGIDFGPGRGTPRQRTVGGGDWTHDEMLTGFFPCAAADGM